MTRIYIALACAAVLGLLLWHDHHETSRANAAVAAQREALQALDAERAARAHSDQIAKDASNAYQADLSRLAAQSHEPLSVRVCKPAHKDPLPAAGSAATGSDAASAPGDFEAAQTDIGPALIEYGLACEANGIQLDRLQEWVRKR